MVGRSDLRSPPDPEPTPVDTLLRISRFLQRLAASEEWSNPPSGSRFGRRIEVTMKVTIDLPDDVSAALKGRWNDVPRRALEVIAVEAYRTGALTETQVRRLLQLESRFQVHELLKEHHVPLRYTEADLEDDLRAQRDLGVLPGR